MKVNQTANNLDIVKMTGTLKNTTTTTLFKVFTTQDNVIRGIKY